MHYSPSIKFRLLLIKFFVHMTQKFNFINCWRHKNFCQFPPRVFTFQTRLPLAKNPCHTLLRRVQSATLCGVNPIKFPTLETKPYSYASPLHLYSNTNYIDQINQLWSWETNKVCRNKRSRAIVRYMIERYYCLLAHERTSKKASVKTGGSEVDWIRSSVG